MKDAMKNDTEIFETMGEMCLILCISETWVKKLTYIVVKFFVCTQRKIGPDTNLSVIYTSSMQFYDKS